MKRIPLSVVAEQHSGGKCGSAMGISGALAFQAVPRCEAVWRDPAPCIAVFARARRLQTAQAAGRCLRVACYLGNRGRLGVWPCDVHLRGHAGQGRWIIFWKIRPKNDFLGDMLPAGGASNSALNVPTWRNPGASMPLSRAARRKLHSAYRPSRHLYRAGKQPKRDLAASRSIIWRHFDASDGQLSRHRPLGASGVINCSNFDSEAAFFILSASMDVGSTAPSMEALETV